MKKFIIIGAVLIIGTLAIWFLITKRDAINKEFVEVGGNLSVVPEVKPINNIDSLNTEKKIMNATLHTNKGDIIIEFFESQTPKTVANFTKLAKEGFYDGTKFHRVIKGFMIQGGDPLSKDDSKMDLWGSGGPGYIVPAEIGVKNTRGTIATARLGDQVNPKKDSSGSQFFINTVDNAFLDGNYTVFGKVVTGMDVVTKIENTPTNAGDRPLTPAVIEKISLK